MKPAMHNLLAAFAIATTVATTVATTLTMSTVATATSPAPASQEKLAKEPLTVVYWTARDCRWCTWWEGKVIGSGGEAKFLASAEGKAVRYVVLKKPLLSAPYQESDFPAEHKWLWERVKSESDGKIRGYPSFSLYEGKKMVAYALGEPEVEKVLLPAIREKMKP